MLLLGIDPGRTSGGIVWKCTNSGQYGGTRMPLTPRQLYTYLYDLAVCYGPIQAHIEQVQVMGKAFGAKAALSYGQHYGELIGTLSALKAQIHEVRPSVWKRKLNVSADKQTAIILCEKLFPELDLKPGKCTKCHEGIAEAALIMRYGELIG